MWRRRAGGGGARQPGGGALRGGCRGGDPAGAASSRGPGALPARASRPPRTGSRGACVPARGRVGGRTRAAPRDHPTRRTHLRFARTVALLRRRSGHGHTGGRRGARGARRHRRRRGPTGGGCGRRSLRRRRRCTTGHTTGHTSGHTTGRAVRGRRRGFSVVPRALVPAVAGGGGWRHDRPGRTVPAVGVAVPGRRGGIGRGRRDGAIRSSWCVGATHGCRRRRPTARRRAPASGHARRRALRRTGAAPRVGRVRRAPAGRVTGGGAVRAGAGLHPVRRGGRDRSR